jgi:hypothetical protein
MGALEQRLITTDLDTAGAWHRLFHKAANAGGWYFGQSDIHGQGIIAGQDYQPGDEIGPAMTAGDDDEFGAKVWNLTPLARWCNHQRNANARLVKTDNQFVLVADKPIEANTEIFADYGQVTRAVGPHSRMLWEGKDIPESDLSDYVEK